MACGGHVAMALWQLGFPDQALKRAEESWRRTKQLGHKFSYAMGLFLYRKVLDFCGRADLASARIEEEYKICHEQGFVFFEVHAIFARGAALLRNGKVDEARRLFDVGLPMREASGGNLSMEYPYRDVAEAFLVAGLPDEAEAWIQRGFDLVENHHMRGLESEFLRLKGEIATAAGDQAGAEGFYQRALEAARRQEVRSWELQTTISFSELRRRQGRVGEARQMLAAVYSSFSEGFETADLKKAKALLAGLGAEAGSG
jgi:tetratricopeptide (TPR) repeat protein